MCLLGLPTSLTGRYEWRSRHIRMRFTPTVIEILSLVRLIFVIGFLVKKWTCKRIYCSPSCSIKNSRSRRKIYHLYHLLYQTSSTIRTNFVQNLCHFQWKLTRSSYIYHLYHLLYETSSTIRTDFVQNLYHFLLFYNFGSWAFIIWLLTVFNGSRSVVGRSLPVFYTETVDTTRLDTDTRWYLQLVD